MVRYNSGCCRCVAQRCPKFSTVVMGRFNTSIFFSVTKCFWGTDFTFIIFPTHLWLDISVSLSLLRAGLNSWWWEGDKQGCCFQKSLIGTNLGDKKEALLWKSIHTAKALGGNAWCEIKWLPWYWRCLVKQPLMGLCSHPQPPLVQTQTVTITAASNSLPTGISTTEVPIVPTKTFTYESSKVGAPRTCSAQICLSFIIWLVAQADHKQVWEDQTRGSKDEHELQHRPFPGWRSGSQNLRRSLNVTFLWFLPSLGDSWWDRWGQGRHNYVQL